MIFAKYMIIERRNDMKPLIGITSYFVKDRELSAMRYRGFKGQDMLMLTMDYGKCVHLAQGIPIIIPVIDDENYLENLLSKLDAIIFTGGPDINPIKYGQSLKRGIGLVVSERDDFELKLLDKSLKKSIPVLGICRGFQLINVYFGGTLHQDIYVSNIVQVEHAALNVPKYNYCHRVSISNGSILSDIFRKKELMVNSYHHQAIDKIGKGLIETAFSEDGIIEGFEHKDFPRLFGVQWHPEMMAEVYDEQLEIFKYFVNSSMENNKSKEGGIQL